MRITTNMIYSQSLDGILESQKRLIRAEEVINKQTNIVTPSDDPTGATKVVLFEEDLSRLDQFKENAIDLENTLSQQETILDGINNSLTRANTLAIQAGNGALNFGDRQSVAAELSLIRDEIYDLMNAKDAQGDYLFAGAKSDQMPFLQNTNGVYEYKGDQSANKIQISETLKLESTAPGAGFSVFEDVPARSTFTGLASTATAELLTKEGDTFDRFNRTNFVNIPPAAPNSNDYRVVIGAGTYQIEDNVGTVLQSGGFTSGNTINFEGLEIKDLVGGAGDQLNFSLDPPNKKNILNAMTEMIENIQSIEIPNNKLFGSIEDTIFSFSKTQESIGLARSEIGGRLNVVKSVNLSNADLEINIKEAKAKISETDFAEATIELKKQETALNAASQIFGRVTNLSLFNFL